MTAPDPSAGQPGRILVVDDEGTNRRILTTILTRLGHQVLEASDGHEALDLVRRESPDLVLLDLLMPRLDGYGTCRELKSNPKTRLIPVIMITDLGDLPNKLRAVDLGADEFLSKPFNVLELTARVKSLLSLKRFTDELEHASRILESFAHAVESRDHYTGNHCKRLGEYGSRVGGELGLSEEDCRILRLGGIYHDLGKIAISDTILNKPGRLTPEEFGLMKAHPVTGYSLCEGMRTLEKVLPLIRHHHEKLDGSGYPDGLKGGQITLPVRIITVVDVYDALATKRSYKDSMPPDKCLDILRQETDKGWWDRDVVEALARALARA